MFTNIISPVTAEKIDSYVSRLTVFIKVAIIVYFMFSLQPVAIYIVAIDYGIRALGYDRYSPLCLLAGLIIKATGLAPEIRYKAPDFFASWLGFICAVLGSVFITAGMPIPAVGIIGLFIVLATLHSVFSFFFSCLIYKYLVFPLLTKQAA